MTWARTARRARLPWPRLPGPRLPGPLLRALLLPGLLLLGACAPEPERADTAAEWEVAAEPSVTIGEMDGDPAYLFDRIAGVRSLPDGRIVVADGSSGTIRVYGADGAFHREMGGLGRGPGEFTYLSALTIAPPDTIVVYDSRSLRLTKLRPTGELVSTLEFRPSDGWPEVYLGSYADGAHAAAWIRQVPRDPSVVTRDVMQLGRIGADGRLDRQLGTARGMLRAGSPLPFSPHFLATMLGDTIYHTDGLAGVIEATGPSGEPVRTFQIDLAGWDLEEARTRVAPALDTAGARRLAGMEAPGLDSIPTIADLLSDGEGRLWLKRYDPSTDSHWVRPRLTGGEWVVVEPDGRRVARVQVPVGVRLEAVSGDRLIGVAVDELGVERVQLFHLDTGSH